VSRIYSEPSHRDGGKKEGRRGGGGVLMDTTFCNREREHFRGFEVAWQHPAHHFGKGKLGVSQIFGR